MSTNTVLMAPKAGVKESGEIFDVWRLIEHPRVSNEAAIRSLCRNAYLGEGTALARVLGRYKMFVDTRDIGISSHLLMDGFWEMWVTEAMFGFIRQGMTVCDIGANLGYYTMLMADLTGPTGRMLSFEPNPAMATRLRKSVEVNGFGPITTVHELALGDAKGEIALEVNQEQPGGAHMVAYDRRAGALAIPMRRFDAIPGALEADVIKIDVEGAEQQVWAGMSGLLARKRALTVFMEFTVNRYKDAHGFLDQILNHDFSLNIVDHNDGVRPATREEIFAQPGVDHMLLFTRPDLTDGSSPNDAPPSTDA
jgi:FkbM family methyltransferase